MQNGDREPTMAKHVSLSALSQVIPQSDDKITPSGGPIDLLDFFLELGSVRKQSPLNVVIGEKPMNKDAGYGDSFKPVEGFRQVGNCLPRAEPSNGHKFANKALNIGSAWGSRLG
jgi:hypothetical protein